MQIIGGVFNTRAPKILAVLIHVTFQETRVSTAEQEPGTELPQSIMAEPPKPEGAPVAASTPKPKPQNPVFRAMGIIRQTTPLVSRLD
jgi:hypothetical protein